MQPTKAQVHSHWMHHATSSVLRTVSPDRKEDDCRERERERERERDRERERRDELSGRKLLIEKRRAQMRKRPTFFEAASCTSVVRT